MRQVHTQVGSPTNSIRWHRAELITRWRERGAGRATTVSQGQAPKPRHPWEAFEIRMKVWWGSRALADLRRASLRQMQEALRPSIPWLACASDVRRTQSCERSLRGLGRGLGRVGRELTRPTPTSRIRSLQFQGVPIRADCPVRAHRDPISFVHHFPHTAAGGVIVLVVCPPREEVETHPRGDVPA